jgi:pyruvate formate lyase activating enzyme
VDPIEKKPLFHFLPGTQALSLATSGCSLRCLNCQNWEISQKKPEELKDATGEELRLGSGYTGPLRAGDLQRASLFPEDVVLLAQHSSSRSIAYTYSEPTSYYEYMVDTAKRARAAGIKNVWVTNGYINPEPLGGLAKYLDAANVDLKSFSEEIYAELNSGKLAPILATLQLLKQRGVWFEVTNLVVPRYTDDLTMIDRMCDWLVSNLGPDYPVHFSRFHPKYELKRLSSTPVQTLVRAREIAKAAGLHHVYLGNVRGVTDAETTFCAKCGKRVVERTIYSVETVQIGRDGTCAHCGAPVAGVWSSS